MSFSGLVYSLANEDSFAEVRLLTDHHTSLLCVCGSGVRAVPLLSQSTSRLVLVDTNRLQILFAKMRFAAIEAFDWKTYCDFFGYVGELTPEDREDLFEVLPLEQKEKHSLRLLLKAAAWERPCYLGKWEQSIQRLSFFIRKAVGRQFLQVFDLPDAASQRVFLEEMFETSRWKAAVGLLSQSALLKNFLFRGRFPPLNLESTGRDYYDLGLRHAFTSVSVQENFFLNLLFLGRVDASCLPPDAQPKVFAQAKASRALGNIEFRVGEVRRELWKAGSLCEPFDFVSLSDVPSYWSAIEFQEALLALQSSLSAGGICVARFYRHRPFGEAQLASREGAWAGLVGSLLPRDATGLYELRSIAREGTC